MNYSLSQDDIIRLISIKGENKNIDYKEKFNWKKSAKDEKLGIVKDILAMANTQDGGKIIFGVSDKDFTLVGLSPEDFSSFDQTEVNDFLHKYTDPSFSCYIYKRNVENKNVIVIDVPEFTEEIIICKDNAHSSNDPDKLILKAGQIYIRTDKGSSSAVSCSIEMRELLSRALTKKRDYLLQNLKQLLKGEPTKITDKSQKIYDEEIKEANLFIQSNIGDEIKKYGHWEIIVYPLDYNENRIKDHKSVKTLLEQAKVSLRGWSFPHSDNKNASNFTGGRQSFTLWGRYVEGLGHIKMAYLFGNRLSGKI